MTGEELKNKIICLDESLANIAKTIGTTPQNLDSKLKTKDVKSGFLETLAKAYNKPIGYFFDEPCGNVHTEGENSPASYYGNAQAITTDNKHLETLLEEKDKRIQLLETMLKNNNLL